MTKIQARHLSRRLYDAEFDFNCFGHRALSTYMLATLPRSGSTFCAIKLWQTGLLGAPMEYLNFSVVGDLFKRLGYQLQEGNLLHPDRIGPYWKNVQYLRGSPNGVFGYKMFTSNFLEISKKYPAFLSELTPNYVIYLTRRDELGQAFSYSRAVRSKVWFGGVGNTPDVSYDFNHIKKSLETIRNQKSSWERIFSMVKVVPIRIFYEDLLSETDLTISYILNNLGIKNDPAFAVDVPITIRQTDGVSKEWRTRFHADREAESHLTNQRIEHF